MTRSPAPSAALVATPVDLGGLRLENRLLCAPMAGVSDRAFRLLVREAGCALAFPEMVSDKALLWGNERTAEMAAPYPGEKPFALQLLGRDPDTLARAAALACDRWPLSLVDVNMGCPVPKVAKNGEGAALLRAPDLCAAIVERVVRVVGSRVPVSCKIRLGFDQPRAVEVARKVAAAGAAFVTVHGRLRTQSYSTPADWPAIGEVVAAVNVPIVGNGDVLAPEDAARMMAQTGCQAVMIGRGALGNPWIFTRALRLARTGDPGPHPTAVERVETALRHLRTAQADKGERHAVLEMRHHGCWYIKGLPGASAVRAKLMKASTVADMAGVFESYSAALRQASSGSGES